MRNNVDSLKVFLEDYLRQRGISLRKPFRCLNPDHEDRHPSMSYHDRANNVHCFACGATYDLFDLVGLDYSIADFKGQLEKVCEIFGVDMPAPRVLAEREPAKPEIPDRGEELEALRQKAGDELDYFAQRGIAPALCLEYGLFQWQGRAYIPVVEQGRCTGWCARATDDETQPRYLNSPGRLGLWNGDLVTQNGNGKRLFVTEGVFDALCLIQMGEWALSLCGSQNSGKLLERLRRGEGKGWRFVLCGDPDKAGRKMNGDLERGLAQLGLPCQILSLTPEDGDIARLHLENPQRLRQLLEPPADPPHPEETAYPPTSAAAMLDDFFTEALSPRVRQGIATGFAALDHQLEGGLFPGLYILGAVSSAGKTSFLLQMADYIAENSADVLFFSLEQSPRELMAKSISRTTAVLCRRGETPFTTRQLLSGPGPTALGRRQLLLDAREVYSQAAAGLFVREGRPDLTAAGIRSQVESHIAARGRAPVVMVDYLQILQGADSRLTDKQNMDRVVAELKCLSRDFSVPVVAVSSFNRESYRTAASMEAFKESGTVEYCADVLLALQLKGTGGKDFDQNRAKLQQPRQLELVVLKNRNGVPYGRIPLHYDARYNLFEETLRLARLQNEPTTKAR